MVDEYIAKYKKGFEFEFFERVSQELNGINVTVDVYVFSDDYQRRQKADIKLEKNGLEYRCECVDINRWNNMFDCVEIDGKAYLLFRKTLYGFTLLDSETLTEEYEYFPEAVLDFETESFIITETKSFGSYLVFIGCYWADDYLFYAFDYNNKRFLNLSAEYDVLANDGEMTAENGILSLSDKSKQVIITHDELKKHFASKSTSDFILY